MSNETGETTHPVVVVVNDDVTQGLLYAGLLRKQGIHVQMFEGAEKALAYMRESPPDLLVTDVNMPGIDGWRLCRLMRSAEYASLNALPILVVSATFSGDEPRKIAHDLGADAFLSAPVDGRQFLRVVDDLLQNNLTMELPLVLVVEESRALAGILKQAFVTNGYRVDIAATAQEARAAIREHPYDFAILDHVVPGGKGDQLLDRLHADQPACICLMMTSDPDPELAQDWMKRGATAYLRKPFSPEFLLELCARARREHTLLRSVDLLKARTQQLRNSEKLHRNLVELAPDVIFTLTAEGGIRSINSAFEELTGWSRDEWIGLPFEGIIHPDDLPLAWERLLASLRGEDVSRYQLRIRTQAGLYRICEFLIRPVWGADGKAHSVLGIARDVTEREEHQNILRLQSMVLNQIQDFVTVTDLDGIVTFSNETEVKKLGYPREELIGCSTQKFGENSEVGATQREILEETLRSGHWRGEVVNRTADGKELILDCRTSVVHDSRGNVVALCGISTDITEQKKLQDQLHRAQRLDSIGRLAGGVAHDFNNMLGVILGNVEMAMDLVDSKQEVSTFLQQIHEAVLRSAKLTRQLLAFARKQEISPRVLDLNATVSDMVSMLKRVIGEPIDFQWCPAPDLWLVKMDPSQVDQILVNLCVNARDAIGTQGRVVVSTRNIRLTASDCARIPDAVPGEYVRLSVRDTGSGIDSETADKIFEPFFTTKEEGKGTGLGLSTVYGIARQNLGFVTLQSQLGEGSEFSVYIPGIPSGVVDVEPLKEATAAVKGNEETILVVEDEPSMLELTSSMLERLGYKVLKAASPREAIETAKRHEGNIDLLMSDVIMPGMNGRVLARELQAHYPGLRSVFMSGYAADVIVQHGALEAGGHFLQKPVSMRKLAEKVRDVLNGLL